MLRTIASAWLSHAGSGDRRRDDLVVSRESVRRELSTAGEWEAAASRLDIAPGLAFMIQTGIPADGSGVPEIGERVGDGDRLASPQSLVNPRGHNPLRNEQVEAWVQARARRELQDG